MRSLPLAVIAFLLCCQCQQPPNSEIKETASAFKQALITHNTEKMASLLTPDAVDYNLTTQEATTGNQAISAYLVSLLGPSEAIPEYSTTIENISWKGEDLARVNGLLEVQTKTHPKKEVAFLITFKKEGTTWRISELTHLLIQPPPSHNEQLKGLSWLVGNWVNSDECTNFTASYAWDENRNFLKEKFVLNLLGHKDLSGTQIIGWDPVKETIFSWIIDSDGGFGKSSWTHDDGTWYVTTSYTLASGSRSSATHIYNQVDNDTYTFSSTSRDVDGRLLPNIGPFTFKRTSKVK